MARDGSTVDPAVALTLHLPMSAARPRNRRRPGL